MLSIFKIIIFSLKFSFVFFSSNAQTFDWVRSAGGAGYDVGFGIVADKANNSYITGAFEEVLYLGADSLISNGDRDFFIAKYDSTGKILWAKSYGGPGVDFFADIKLNESENQIWVTGFISDTVLLGNDTLISRGLTDICLLKLDTSGAIIWAEQAGGQWVDRGISISLDKKNNAYITGLFEDTLFVADTFLLSKGKEDIFILKYDSNGSWLNANAFSGGNSDIGWGIATDDHFDSYIVGDFKDTLVLNSDSLFSSASDKEDIIIIKLDSLFRIVWYNHFEGLQRNNIRNIQIAPSGFLYITGFFEGILEIGQYVLESESEVDGFLAQINSNGNINWVRQMAGTGKDYSYGIAVDSKDNVYATGYAFDPATTNIYRTDDSGGDVFIYKFNPSGELLWKLFGGEKSTTYGFKIDIGSDEDIFVTGYYADSNSIFNNVDTLLLQGINDILLCKINNPTLIFDSLSRTTICAGDTIVAYFSASDAVLQNNNLYVLQLSDSAGDYTTPYTLGFISTSAPDTAIQFIVPDSLPPSSYYRGRVISTNPKLISNSIEIVIDKCLAVANPFLLKDKIKVFPNPSSGVIISHIKTDHSQPLNMEIYNSLGQKVKEARTFLFKGNNSCILYLGDLRHGEYIIRYNFNNTHSAHQTIILIPN